MNRRILDLSQHSLQDYIDCPLRFKLRYLDQFAWPAAQTDDQLQNELHQRQGIEFHRLVQQMITEIPVEVLDRSISDPLVLAWWQSFLAIKSTLPTGLDALPGLIRLAEHTLMTQLGGQRLLAKYDLLVVQPGHQIWIFDWKTGRRPLPHSRLMERVQTRVYLYLAVAAGSQWNGGQPFPAGQVEMMYWQSADPLQPIHLPYSAGQFEQDRLFLTGLVGQIENLAQEDFVKTSDERQCRFCNYRSYCERGLLPGSQEEYEKTDAGDLDLSDVEPVEY